MKNAIKWWWGIVLAFALLGAARYVLPLPFVNEVLIFSIYTIGCSFLLGRVGFISFGQPAYLAFGAYGTAFYLFYVGGNPYVGILAGVACGFIAACIVGPLFVRLRSDYFALVNLALAVIVFYMMQKVLAEYTKGDNGLWFLTNISSTPVLNIGKSSDFFIFALLVAAAVWALYKYLDDTLFGACCLATKINEAKFQFLGYSNFQVRLIAFVIANTTTALAGSLYAVYLGSVSPEITAAARTADPVVVTILGGVGTLFGPLVGTLAYTGLRDVISNYASKVVGNLEIFNALPPAIGEMFGRLVGSWEFFVGFILVFIMLAGEKGLWGSAAPWLQRLFSRNKPAGGETR